VGAVGEQVASHLAQATGEADFDRRLARLESEIQRLSQEDQQAVAAQVEHAPSNLEETVREYALKVLADITSGVLSAALKHWLGV